MRISLRVTGRYENGIVKFIPTVSVFPKGGSVIDDEVSRAFGNSLVKSINQALFNIKIGMRAQELLTYEEEVELCNKRDKGDFGEIVIDIGFIQHGMRKTYFCSMFPFEDCASVRTLNILPVFGRFAYAWANTLKRKVQPGRFKDARSIQIRTECPVSEIAMHHVWISDDKTLGKFNPAKVLDEKTGDPIL